MKKTQVVVTLAGLLVLTGCTKPVMQDNRYIPAKDDRAVGASRQYDDFGSDNKTFGSIPPASEDSQTEFAPAPQPQPQAQPQVQTQPQNNRPYRQYAPMENVKSSGGITDSRPARKSGKSGKRSAGKVALPKGGIYVVKSGDYPAKIAKKFGVSVSALLEANKMTMADAKRLKIGQKLVGADLALVPGNGQHLVSRTFHRARLVRRDVPRGRRDHALIGTQGHGDDGRVGLCAAHKEADVRPGAFARRADVFSRLRRVDIVAVAGLRFQIGLDQSLQNGGMRSRGIIAFK